MNTTSQSYPAPARRRGFTLIEVLVVLALIALLMFFTVPGLQDVIKGSKLTQAADQLVGDLNLARQTAIKEGVTVEVRFYKYPDPDAGPAETPKGFGAYQMFRLKEDVTSPTDYTVPRIGHPLLPKVAKLPQGILMLESKRWSSVFTEDEVFKGEEFVKGLIPGLRDTKTEFRSFVISAQGETNLDKSGAKQWYITVLNEAELLKFADVESINPGNFVTVQIDPYTAQTRLFQP